MTTPSKIISQELSSKKLSSKELSPTNLIPNDLIELGTVVDAQGVKGHVKIRPFSNEPIALLNAQTIWLKKNEHSDLKSFQVLSARLHIGNIIMELEGLNDRDLALAFKSYAVLMSREAFPKTDKDEYYWLDLIGIPVENTNGELLGKVIEMLDNSVQSVILIENDVKKQHLIPFIKEYVIEVDMVNKKPSRILVDWQVDW